MWVVAAPALEYNRWKLLSLVVGVVEHAPDRSTLDAIALDRLSPLAAVSRLPGRLLVTFHHTGPREFWTFLRHGVGDAWNLLGLVDAILAVRSAG